MEASLEEAEVDLTSLAAEAAEEVTTARKREQISTIALELSLMKL